MCHLKLDQMIVLNTFPLQKVSLRLDLYIFIKIIIQLLKNKISYLVILSSKHLDSHDGKNQPENQTNQEHIENTWDGLNQCIDHNLK